MFAESHDTEPLCIFSACGRSDGLPRVKGLNGFDDALDGLFVEEAAGLAVFDGLEGAASAVGDDGCAAGLGFDWGDAEILFGGENEGFDVLHLILEDFERLVVHHHDIETRDRVNLLKSGLSLIHVEVS